MAELTHFDDRGAARMVDVGSKPEGERTARASALVRLAPETVALIRDRSAAKGDVLQVARLAGIQAAKRAGELIPLCHPLPLSAVTVELAVADETTVRIEALVKTVGRTGVEMEALTAAAVAALTVYDMVKSVDRGVTIEAVRLEEKTGGTRGPWRRPN
jgi:cyclic pyranopterin phosphate synthase